MTITLSTIGSTNITIDVGPSPFEEAPGGVLISYRLHDGPITFTLTVHEATALIAEIIEQLTTPPHPGQRRGTPKLASLPDNPWSSGPRVAATSRNLLADPDRDRALPASTSAEHSA